MNFNWSSLWKRCYNYKSRQNVNTAPREDGDIDWNGDWSTEDKIDQPKHLSWSAFLIFQLENLAIDGVDHDWWTGATDAGNEGTWTWEDDERSHLSDGDNHGQWSWGAVHRNEKDKFGANNYVLHKSATVFDRWVDNEERVGDFLWAANEPSGGTFQVKVKFATEFASTDVNRISDFWSKIWCASPELPYAGG